MSDCRVIEVRDQLPEYLHERLGAAEQRVVEMHLSECEECRAELATLRAVRDAFARTTPAVDVGAIVRALPAPSARRSRGTRPWMLRLAAAISFISIGGMSLVVARSFYGPSTAVTADSIARSTTGDSALPAVASSGQGVAPATPVGLTVGGGVSDLEADQLEQLLGALETIEAVPSADPDESIAQTLPTSTGRK
ncbi:MAG: zf-HC2 domain-containing protein [Gemmatimonadaceae bacterium]